MRLLLAGLLALGACSTAVPVPLPSAAVQVEDAMAAMRAEAAKVGPAGLYPCEADVQFNVTGSNNAQLSGIGLPGGPKLGLGTSGSSGNTVQLKLKSPECGAHAAPGETPAMGTMPHGWHGAP